jgi:spore germination protein KB
MLTAGYFSEALVFLVLFPYLKEGSNVNKTLVWSSLLFTAAFLVMVIPTLTLLGLDVARHSWNPYYMFTRQVTAYEFIQRVESLNVIAWFLGVLIKTALFNYLACFTLSKVFGTRSHRAYIGPVFLITFLVNLLPFVNRSSVIDLLRSHLVFPPIVLFNIVVLPSVVIIVYLFRRKSIDPRLRGGAEKKTRGGGKPRPAQGGP